MRSVATLNVSTGISNSARAIRTTVPLAQQVSEIFNWRIGTPATHSIRHEGKYFAASQRQMSEITSTAPAGLQR